MIRDVCSNPRYYPQKVQRAVSKRRGKGWGLPGLTVAIATPPFSSRIPPIRRYTQNTIYKYSIIGREDIEDNKIQDYRASLADEQRFKRGSNS